MLHLERLLYQIAKNEIPSRELQAAFDEVAVQLLRKHKMVAGHSNYLIKELEIYFYSEYYNHQDPYVHGNMYKKVQRQGEFGAWYFHRFVSIDTYQRMKRRGLDLTFGNKEHGNYGGILIRKIQNLDNYVFTEGIGNIVSRLIMDIGVDKLPYIATGDGRQVFDVNAPLHIEVFQLQGNQLPIMKRQRFGLSYSPENAQEKLYYDKQYCYFNDLEVTLVQP